MANVIGGINLAQIAQNSLDALLVEAFPLRAFTTDFSADIADVGESVSTRVASAVAVGDATTGYTAADVTSTAKTITLDNHKHFTMAFTDLEIAKGGMTLLERTFVRPAVHAVVNSMMDAVLAKVKNAPFTSNSVVAAADFDADDVADCAKDLTVLNVPRTGRSLIVPPTYYGNLAKDSAIQAAYAYGGSEAIRENKVPRVHGFDVYEYGDIPANGENLAAFACGQESLLIAARQPALPQNWYGSVESATDPDSGLTIQLRNWYDGTAGKQNIAATVMFGVGTGTLGLKRIKSAA